MDEPRINLPAWIPWATTACLAALVACLGEMLIIERAHTDLLRDKATLTDAAMRAMENQIDAERIVNRRELENLRPKAGSPKGLQVALLLPAPGAPVHARPPALGAVVWDPADGRGLIRLSGPSAQAPDRDYQLWLLGPGPSYPSSCGAFHADTGEDGAVIEIEVGAAVMPGCRFVLVDGERGGLPSFDEAKARGSIVLATLPMTGKIAVR